MFDYLDDGFYENVTDLMKTEYINLYDSMEGSKLLETVVNLSNKIEGKIYLYRPDIMAKFKDAGISMITENIGNKR